MPKRPEVKRGDILYCRKAVRFGGRVYPVGGIFPYTKIAVSWRQVFLMYAAYSLITDNDVTFKDVHATADTVLRKKNQKEIDDLFKKRTKPKKTTKQTKKTKKTTPPKKSKRTK